VTKDEVISLINTILTEENTDSDVEIKITIDSEVGDDGWDSLGQLSVLAALDEAFDGKVAAINEIGDADSVKSIIQILQNNDLM